MSRMMYPGNYLVRSGVSGMGGSFPAGTLYVDTLPLFVDTFYLTCGIGSPVYDTFTGANGTALNGRLPDVGPAAEVITASTWLITSNTAYRSASGSDGNDVIAYDAGVADCTILCTISSNVQYAGIAWRVADSANMWFFRIESAGAVSLYEKTGGGYTGRGSGTALAAGTPVTWKVVLLGTAMTIYEETSPGVFTQRITHTSSQHQSATKHGLFAGVGTERFDNFTVQLS